MRRNSSRGSASPTTYRGGSGRRRKRRSNRLAKCAAFIVGAYALVASLFYYRATHHEHRGPTLRGAKKKPPPPRARVALALPFVGPRLPPFFKAFARSCGNAIGAVDVLLLLSDPDAVPVEARNSRPPWLPDNVHFVKVGANRFARLHARIPYPRARQIYPGDEDIDERREPLAAALRDAFIRNPRQLVEFKPAIGVVFQEYLRNYSHWAFGDFDILMGDMNSFLDEDELQAFDVVSFGFGDSWRAYARGQWTHHKNLPHVNAAYSYCSFLGAARLEDRLLRGAHYESAEGCYSTALAQASLRFKITTKHFTDATQKGDKDAAWLAESEIRRCAGDEDDEGRHCRPLAPRTPREKRSNQNRWERVRRLPVGAKRCMNWVNPAYQTCLEGGDYDAGDTVVLDADGAYKRKRGPVDALRVPGTSFSVAAFFHVQEWKKKWRSFSVSWVATSDTILGTRFGLVPVPPRVELNQTPSSRRGYGDTIASMSWGARNLISTQVPPLTPLGVDKAIAQRLRDARSVEYCAFKACEDIPRAFQRDDLRWARSGSVGVGPFRNAGEEGVGLVVVASLLRKDLDTKLLRVKENACGWPGPSIVVLAADEAGWDVSVEAFRACPRTVLLGRIGDDDGESLEKALANLGLESCPCRRCLVLRGDEHLSSNTYEAISHMEVAMGTTLIIPEFRSESVPTTMDELRSLVRSGRAQAAPANRCPETTPALATKKYENWWGGVEGVVDTYQITFEGSEKALAWQASGALVVMDSVDARGDRRLVREVEEHRGPGCYDGLLARALATQHADAFAVVPNAFAVAAPYVVNGTAPCGCRPGVENQPPTKTMRRSVRDYDAYLVRAVGARGDADDEARARGL